MDELERKLIGDLSSKVDILEKAVEVNAQHIDRLASFMQNTLEAVKEAVERQKREATDGK